MARDEVDRNRSSYPPMFSANCRPGMARESEGRRRHLDYGEAQSFQDLPLCRFLRLIWDELDAGLAGSSGISVEDFQTHPHDPWVLAPIEHAGKIRSRIASETTYGRSAEATASRAWAPAETPEASTVYKMPWWGMLIPGSARARPMQWSARRSVRPRRWSASHGSRVFGRLADELASGRAGPAYSLVASGDRLIAQGRRSCHVLWPHASSPPVTIATHECFFDI
jgi:hypothetical protein